MQEVLLKKGNMMNLDQTKDEIMIGIPTERMVPLVDSQKEKDKGLVDPSQEPEVSMVNQQVELLHSVGPHLLPHLET